MNEKKSSFLGKFLKGIAITLLIITILLTIVSAVGTFCVAFRAEKFKDMIPLVPYKTLYKFFMGVSLVAGIWGILSAIALIKGKTNGFRNTFIFLIVGAVSAASQMATSISLYGNGKPINIRVYVTLLTLIILFLFKLPPLNKIVDFGRSAKAGGSGGLSAGIAMFICGIITLTTRIWVGFSHISSDGKNWVDVIDMPLRFVSLGMMVGGIVWILSCRSFFNRKKNFNVSDFSFNGLSILGKQESKVKSKIV